MVRPNMIRWNSITLVACLALLVALGGCRGRRLETRGTSVAAGDTLYGRLPAQRSSQAFSFEGVESSMLDFTLKADVGNVAAPDVTLTDPEGNPVDLMAATTTAKGAATMQVRDVVLLRNGLYKLTVRPPMKCQNTFYRFNHCLRFPTPAPRNVRLDSCSVQPVFVTAPRGGLIVLEIRPVSGGVVPMVKGVTDPWGGRALDKTQVPQGALPPRVSRGHLNEMVLTFTAPRPGKYKILASAQRGTSGVAKLSVRVKTPRPTSVRLVNHPNTLPNYGLPGGSAPAPMSPPNPMSPPPPPPPGGGTVGFPAPEDPIAQR